MKISLISPYTVIMAYGLRTISASLKREGHDVKLIFLPTRSGVPYGENVFGELAELAGDSRLIGISLTTNLFEKAVSLTQKLKQSCRAPVIWGGTHATARPEECLNYADLVCLGEGEETVPRLAAMISGGESFLDLPGIWLRDKGGIIKNKLPPLIQDLDSIPYPDYDLQTHYLLHDGHIRPMTLDLLKMQLRGDYLAHPTRGCPNGCTYCHNNMLNRLYPAPQKTFRKRSVDNIIGELVLAKKKLPFTDHITFDDDMFFSLSAGEIALFSEKSRPEVGLPLQIRGGSPGTVTREKLSSLTAAGLTGLDVGIETASERGRKTYKRPYSNRQTEDCVRIVNEFADKIPLPRYDIIIGSPWETEEDRLEMLLLVAKFPAPYQLNWFRLIFYPGTELHAKALEEGLIKDELNEVYRGSFNVHVDGTSGKLLNETYLNNLLYLQHVYAVHGRNIPLQTLLRLLDRKAHPLRSRLLYFLMRLKAGLLLKRDVLRRAAAEIKGKSAELEHYELD